MKQPGWMAAPAGIAACSVAPLACWWSVAATRSLRHPVTPDFGHLLTAAAAWLLVGCAAWFVLLCAAALVEATTSGRVRAMTWVGCPTQLRALLLASAGVALVAGATVPASATELRPGAGIAGHRTDRRPDNLPVPARPEGGAPTHAGSVHVVMPGDSLWRLAASRMPRDASTVDVARLVARIHHLNRPVIGADPDVLHPGQRLVLPAPLSTRSFPPEESP